MPVQLRPQIEAVREACECLGLPSASAAGFEADDLIATSVAAARDPAAGIASVVIVASGRDLMQLVSEEGEAGGGEAARAAPRRGGHREKKKYSGQVCSRTEWPFGCQCDARIRARISC